MTSRCFERLIPPTLLPLHWCFITGKDNYVCTLLDYTALYSIIQLYTWEIKVNNLERAVGKGDKQVKAFVCLNKSPTVGLSESFQKLYNGSLLIVSKQVNNGRETYSVQFYYKRKKKYCVCWVELRTREVKQEKSVLVHVIGDFDRFQKYYASKL
jgi:hypothetical protein